MKRSRLKLVVCRETLRVLAETDLVRVAGGHPVPALFDTGNAGSTCVNGFPAPPTKP